MIPGLVLLGVLFACIAWGLVRGFWRGYLRRFRARIAERVMAEAQCARAAALDDVVELIHDRQFHGTPVDACRFTACRLVAKLRTRSGA